MADLGTLTVIAASEAEIAKLIFPHMSVTPWEVPDETALRFVPSLVFGEASSLIHLDNSGYIAGTVANNTDWLNGVRVDLYHKPSGTRIGSTVTYSYGDFVFAELVRIPEGFFAVAFDPAGGESFNALIFDRLTPV